MCKWWHTFCTYSSDTSFYRVRLGHKVLASLFYIIVHYFSACYASAVMTRLFLLLVLTISPANRVMSSNVYSLLYVNICPTPPTLSLLIFHSHQLFLTLMLASLSLSSKFLVLFTIFFQSMRRTEQFCR
jgi:hypothetical protein